MRKHEYANLFCMKKCPICNKNFAVTYTGLWTYKINSKFYCSYTCYRKAGGDSGKSDRRHYNKKSIL